MLGWDPASWGWMVWTLHAVGAAYALLFVAYWVRFVAGERRARSGSPEDVRRYNRSLRGFPASLYAKMMGRRPLVPANGGAGKP